MKRITNKYGNRLEIIDYFKGISIIMIFMCHIVQIFDLPTFVLSISSFGRMGCQIFFVLSGYTIAMSYEKRKSSLKDFYKKRWMSLAPGYWLSIFITILIAIITICLTGTNKIDTSLKLEDIIINLFLLNGLVPTEANNLVFRGGWFIGTLFILYVLYPILHTGYKRYCNVFLYSCIIGSVITSSLSFLLFGNVYSGFNNFLYFSFINQLPSFVLGILVYRNAISNHGARVKALLFFVLSFILFYLPHYPFKAVFVPLTFSISFVFLLRVLWNMNFPLRKFISTIGKQSYQIFLLHIFFIWDIPNLLLRSFLPLNVITFMIYCPISFVIVYYLSLIYSRLIDLLTIRLKQII